MRAKRRLFPSLKRQWKQKKKSLLCEQRENKNINRETEIGGGRGGREGGRDGGEGGGKGLCAKRIRKNSNSHFCFKLSLSIHHVFSLSSRFRCNARTMVNCSKPYANNKLL